MVFGSRKITGILCLATFSSFCFAASYTPPSAAVSALNKYRSYSELTTAAGSMDLDKYTWNLTTWQMSHGGFSKAHASLYVNAWDKSAELSSWSGKDGTPLGMYDNNATVQEMRLLAVRYKATKVDTLKTRFKSSFNKAVDFVINSARANGGWPQVWPKRGNYSDQITFNDNAMIRLMVLVQDIVNKAEPFDSDITDATKLAKLQTQLEKAVAYILKAQIVNNSAPTVWCAQHDTSNYKPVGARAYELASKSGSESAGVVWYLMNYSNQSADVQKAVKGALAWYKKNRVADLKFSSGNFVASSGASMWYRFYEVDSDQYFFCDRDGASTKTQDITKLSDERRTGYQWAGDYGSSLLNAESAYLNAIAGISGVSSSSAAVSSSSAKSSSSLAASSSSVIASSSSAVSGAATLTKHGGGSAKQSVAQGAAIANFYYTIANATGATVTGLPEGVSYEVIGSNVNISGTVSASVAVGAYNFTVTTTGATENATASGTITVTAGTTAIPVNVTASKLSVNPVMSGSAQVSLSVNYQGIAKVSLSDMSGRTVLSRAFHVVPGTNEITISRGALPAGVYFIKVNTTYDHLQAKVFAE